MATFWPRSLNSMVVNVTRGLTNKFNSWLIIKSCLYYIRHPTSYILHPTSDIWDRTSEIRLLCTGSIRLSYEERLHSAWQDGGVHGIFYGKLSWKGDREVVLKNWTKLITFKATKFRPPFTYTSARAVVIKWFSLFPVQSERDNFSLLNWVLAAARD